MNYRKAQFYIVKPLALIMTIVVLFVMLFSLEDFNMSAEMDAMEIDMASSASDVLSILTNSFDCIAYKDIEGGLYGNVIDYNKLVSFNQMYDGVEPECARSYYTGWHAVVEDGYTGEKWSFGADEYSRSVAAKTEEISAVTSMPIAILYSEMNIKPGTITVTMYSGDLERLAGFIDYACMTGRVTNEGYTQTQTFNFEYPITNEDGELCMVLGNDEICRKLYCKTTFSGIEADGEYIVSVKYVPAQDTVVVRA